MTLYMCCARIGGNYFGMGISKELAYRDLCAKWEHDDVAPSKNYECSYFILSEVK